MKDRTECFYRIHRPICSALNAVQHCLESLLQRDKEHTADMLVTSDITYEELIGALLMAEDALLLSEDRALLVAMEEQEYGANT